jgi:hypothetical protein
MSYKTRMLLAVCLSELCIAPLNVWATTITVTNTNDSGPGSCVKHSRMRTTAI